MWSWKTEKLLKDILKEKNKWSNILTLTAKIDNRKGIGLISSRNWLNIKADKVYDKNTKIKNLLINTIKENNDIIIVFIDEAQFLTEKQVYELKKLVIDKKIKCYTYWLLTDFQNNFFEWSYALVKEAKKIIKLESKYSSICKICKKNNANINGRFINWKLVTQWKQVWIEGKKNITYKTICNNCFEKENKKKI